MTDLTPTQKTILQAASTRLDGNIEPLPTNINAGVKPRVIQGLLNRDLITQAGDRYVISPTGFEAIGVPVPTLRSRPVALREGTKQLRMLDLLMRPEGASIEEMCSETGWQKHTVRGLLTNTVKKRLGLIVTSCKDDGQQRRYRASKKAP